MSDDDPRVGTDFGRYRIERRLGEGGFGTVYLAQDRNPRLPRRVALKVLQPELAADEAFRERFLRESLLAIELDHHPSIVPVYDAGEEGDTLFIAMRYIEGTDLARLIAEGGPGPLEPVTRIVGQVADALDVAHAAGLVHRDVKPANIMLSQDLRRAYLADFGLTKRITGPDSGLTQAGQFLGTFHYAAPEQLDGRPVDGRCDLYALGCVLYEALAGAPPFTGEMTAIITGHLTHPPPSLRGARSDLPPAIDTVVARAMAKNPDERYQSGAELEAALAVAVGDAGAAAGVGAAVPPVTPVPAGAPSPPPVTIPPGGPATPPPGVSPAPSRSRLRWVLAGVGAIVVLVVLLLVFVVGGGGGGREFPDEDEEIVLARLPDSLRDTCERVSVPDQPGVGGADARSTMRGTPDEGADRVFFTVFETSQQTADALAATAEDEPVEDTGEDCNQFDGVAHEYVTGDNVVGRVLCFRDGGHSFVVWSAPELHFLGSAFRDDRSDIALYEFWADLVDRVEPEPTGTPEEQLLARVPGDLEAACETLTTDSGPIEGEIAAVTCEPSSGADLVSYIQFESFAAMNTAYQNVLDNNDVERRSGRGCSQGTPGEDSYDRGDETNVGRLACFVDDEGDAVFWWTRDDIFVLTLAFREAGDLAALGEWWSDEAGPL